MLPSITDTVKYCYSYYLTFYLTYYLTFYNSIYILQEVKNMNSFKFSDSNLEGYLAAEPEVAEVDWSLVRARVESSVDSLGVHEVREHYYAGVWAYEDQMGGCPGHVARDIIHPLVSEVIAARF